MRASPSSPPSLRLVGSSGLSPDRSPHKYSTEQPHDKQPVNVNFLEMRSKALALSCIQSWSRGQTDAVPLPLRPPWRAVVPSCAPPNHGPRLLRRSHGRLRLVSTMLCGDPTSPTSGICPAIASTVVVKKMLCGHPQWAPCCA